MEFMDTTEVQPTRLALCLKGSCIKLSDPTTSVDVYKLPLYEMMKDKTERIARYYVGSDPKFHDSSVQERVLMVVGATGAGKSTLINGIVNYILGVEWSDTFRFKLIVEETKSQANSQTSWITAYTIPRFESGNVTYHLTIIDTPGFGDTKGLERDKQIAKQIKQFFTVPPPYGFDQIHGIGFVAQAANARLTPTQSYVFHSILSIFGNDIKDNIFLMLTFADGKRPQVLDAIKEADIPYHEPAFKFNNSALFAGDNDDEDMSFDAMFWKMGVRSFSKFFGEFGRAESKSLQLTREVQREREQLELIIQALQKQVTVALEGINSLNNAKIEMEKNKSIAKKNENFTYTTFKPNIKEVPTGPNHYVTNCLKCNFTCHEYCVFSNNEDKARCGAMRNGYCTMCTNHCHWTQHRNNGFYFVVDRVEVQGTYEDLKKRYYDAKSGVSVQQGIMDGIERDLRKLRKEAFTKILEAHHSLLRLGEIALRPNPLSQVDYIDLLIKSEEGTKGVGWDERRKQYQEFRKQAVFISSLKDIKKSPELLSILDEDSVQVLIEQEEKHKRPGWQDNIQRYRELAKEMRKNPGGKASWEKLTEFKFAT